MDLQSYKYHMFLAEQMEEQAKIEAVVTESILISSGENNLQNMTSVNESIVDSLKNGIMKFMEALGRLWAKFVEAMDVLTKRDKGYLEKYKDIILKTKPINADYTMYDYKKGVEHILRSPIPTFNYASMKEELDDTQKFIDKYLSRFMIGNKDTNFIDGVKAYFRGSADQKKFNSSQLNMTDMYNYCYDYEKIKDMIDKDLKYIEKAAKDGINLVEKMGRENKIAQESANIFEDNKYYSFVYEQFITEGDNNQNNNNQNNNNHNNGNNKNNPSPTNPAASRSVEGGGPNGPNKPSGQYQGANNKDNKNPGVQEKDVNGETVKVATDRIKVYMKVCSDFIAAKLTISEEVYKAYMSIIKVHVRDHLGKKGENKPMDNSTDYANNNNNSDGNKDTKDEGKKRN